MTIQEEQYALVDRLLIDAKGSDVLTPEEFHQLVEIAFYWNDLIQPDTENIRQRMRGAIETYEQHREDNSG